MQNGWKRIKEDYLLCRRSKSMVETEDELQRMVYQFYKTALHYNMRISIEKTKTLAIAIDPTTK
jgi:hypothetical protein